MYLYGASGHGKVIAEIAEEINIKIDAFIDANEKVDKILNYKVLHKLPKSPIEMIISIGDNLVRKNIVDANPQFKYITLFHPNSFISKRANIGSGSVIMAGVSINSETYIGSHCIVNTNSSIDHECQLEDYVHISPNVGLAGNVTIGEGTHVGIGANIIQQVKIGKWCIIGAGSVVINDVPDYAVVVGNPGQIIKFNIHKK
ncbi:acetyltransferase [Chishuiella changwenlii]|uniref:acetyltransferase n=1 Tax=Chishuiella changwenlii TaxID=1434701 RepID=UPI002FD8E2B8